MQEAIYKELLDIADNKGVEVVDSKFTFMNLKGLYVQNEDVQVIFLNESIDDPVERNFILSHELRHHELHQGKIDEDLYSNDTQYRDKLEDEANNYAADLIENIKKDIVI